MARVVGMALSPPAATSCGMVNLYASPGLRAVDRSMALTARLPMSYPQKLRAKTGVTAVRGAVTPRYRPGTPSLAKVLRRTPKVDSCKLDVCMRTFTRSNGWPTTTTQAPPTPPDRKLLRADSGLSTGLDASFCSSVSLLPPALLLAMLTSTSTADAAPGASIVAVDMALWSLLSVLDDEDEEEGPSQFAALALGKENNVITMRSSGL
mmetsp:Transcript_27880/g.65456  ORF Transcript_27880/g.65456 Transcript_27880/m.65456 type:complete len:208 (+) Transcript_27880:684-1307(+)